VRLFCSDSYVTYPLVLELWRNLGDEVVRRRFVMSAR
jgi:hypothetical protein